MQIHYFLAELLLIIGLLGLLLLKQIVKNHESQTRAYVIGLYLTTIVLLIWTQADFNGKTIQDGLFIVDKLSLMVKLLVLGFGLATVVFFDQPILRCGLPVVETYFLIGIQTVGMMLTIACVNWISLFVCLELMYLPIYALIGLHTTNRDAQEAACKYIIMGAFSTGVLLYGISLIYAVSGTFELQALIAPSLTTALNKSTFLGLDPEQSLFLIGGLLVLIALCFKLGVVPFHLWVRDVYEGGLYAAVSLIASAPKLVLVLVWSRVFFDSELSSLKNITWIIFSIGLVSMFFGHFLALVQERIRILLAYSSLAHMGFVLLALGLMSQMGHEAAMVYTIGYTVTIALVFLVLSGMIVNGRRVVLIEDLKGLSITQPSLAFLLLIAIFSLLGLPPFAGFMLKVRVLTALIESQYLGIAVLTLIPSVVAACYYINMIHLMYFQKGNEVSIVESHYSSIQSLLLITGGVFIIGVGIYPSELFQWVSGFYPS